MATNVSKERNHNEVLEYRLNAAAAAASKFIRLVMRMTAKTVVGVGDAFRAAAAVGVIRAVLYMKEMMFEVGEKGVRFTTALVLAQAFAALPVENERRVAVDLGS